MAIIGNSKTILLDDDGVLQFAAPGNYTFETKKKFIQVQLEGGQTTNIDQTSYASVTALSIGVGAHVTMRYEEILNFEIKELAGALDITGSFGFTDAFVTGFFDATVDFDTLLGSAISANGVGTVAANLTLNGSKSDAIKALWDYLDESYVSSGYYNQDINESFVRLGIEYVNYLEAGGEPLTDVVAKYTPDGSDADTNPERAQSMHDNLLGNLWNPVLSDRFSSNSELLAELQSLIPGEYLGRPTFDGNDGSFGGDKHDAVRAFDYEKGWDRPDYVETTISGTVDSAAQDQSGGDMLFGNGNSTDGYAIVSHMGAGVELAVKAKERGGDDYTAVIDADDGLVHYLVESGLQAGSSNRGVWNIDFAFTSGVGAYNDETADEFDFILKLDTDRTEDADFFVFDPADIPDNPDNAFSEQNSWNPAFWPIDGDPLADGVQAYDFGPGQFDIILEAWDNGSLIGINHVVIDVL